jgi:hypothetical protein
VNHWQYWISINGQQAGPYSYEQIKQSLAEGRISYYDYICYSGSNAWVTIQEKPEFAPQPVTSPSPSSSWQEQGGIFLKFVAGVVFALIGIFVLGLGILKYKAHTKNASDKIILDEANKKLAEKAKGEERLVQEKKRIEKLKSLKIALQNKKRMPFSFQLRDLKGVEIRFAIECLGKPSSTGKNFQGLYYSHYDRAWTGMGGGGGPSFRIYTEGHPAEAQLFNPVVGVNFD